MTTPFFDEQRVGFEDNEIYAIGRMLFPNNEEKRCVWILRRYFLLMFHRHLDCLAEDNSRLEYDIYRIVGAQFGAIACKLGGWEKVLRPMLGKTSSLRQVTLEPAGRGLVAGKVLLAVLENGGNISEACETVGEMNLKIIKKDTWKGKTVHPPADAEHIRKNYWYEFNTVAHFWAAAWDFFDDQVYFVETVCNDPNPFNRKMTFDEPIAAYGLFLQRANEIYEKASELYPPWRKNKKIIPSEFG